jgi:L-lactate dehydrogenase complex protein LldG
VERKKEMMHSSSHTDARTVIFASIRENLAKSASFEVHHERSTISSAIVTSPPTDLLETFKESLELVGGRYAFAENEDQAAAHLRTIVGDLSATGIIVSDSELVHRIVNAADIDAIQDASRDELFASDVGITSAQWAIAETGTLVLESGTEQHRLVSLVPPVHVCVVNASSIRQSMGEILELVDPDANPAITFVTGASRTSDIELTLAIGVHGPSELHVIVIKDR